MEVKIYDISQKIGKDERQISLSHKDKSGTISCGDWVHIDEVKNIAQLYSDVVGLSLAFFAELQKRGHILRGPAPEGEEIKEEVKEEKVNGTK